VTAYARMKDINVDFVLRKNPSEGKR